MFLPLAAKVLRQSPLYVVIRVYANNAIDALVPVSSGQMRNVWFPQRIAAYVTAPEQRNIRTKNVSTERDFEYGIAELAKNKKGQKDTTPTVAQIVEETRVEAPRVEVERITVWIPTSRIFFRWIGEINVTWQLMQDTARTKQPTSQHPRTRTSRFLPSTY